MLYINLLLPLVALVAQTASGSSSASVLEMENYGFSGYYQHVAKISNPDKSSCSCKLSDTATTFSGANAPLNEEVSVHLRGPLTLKKFGFYTSSGFVHGTDDDSGDWTRQAYYDGSSATNVTFLNHGGTNSSCAGPALTYADSDGTSTASSSTVLSSDTLINSNEEIVLYSSEECESSGFKKNCGVYRDGIPAYKGFNGTVKMFLFEFTMPTESKVTDKNSDYYNMPAIWLLNAHIARTGQYPSDGTCSCWSSGCGEFDVFEVLNTTEANHLYTTIHDFQGTDNIETGISVPGYIERDTESTMAGGVAFDTNGKAVVWVSNSTSFDSTVKASSVNDWISDAGTSAEETLSSVSAPPPSSLAGGSSSHGKFSVCTMTVIHLVCGFFLSIF